MKLKDKEWKEFFFADIFSITSTSSGIDRNKLIVGNGDTPYITRSERQNGYDSFITKQSYNKNIANVITIGLDTQTVFYQPHDFYTGQNIQILSFSQINRLNAFFLIPLIKTQMAKFSWGGNGATLTRLKRSKIMLPANSKGKPDYDFMEQYMRSKEKELLNKYKAHIISRINRCRVIIDTQTDRKWKEFYITDIFIDLQRGKRLKKGDHKVGDTPYVSSTSFKNGIDAFIRNDKNVRIFDSCLTLANSGSVGATFYHPYTFVASDHVTKLENSYFNKYVYLFISSLLYRFSEKYSFNREINDTRLKKEKILLPINEQNQPDYPYMEGYMKNLEYQKLKKYLDWKQ